MPHHNLVANVRQEFLKDVASKRPVTNKIILLGPDHFSNNQRQTMISDQPWKLSNGNFLFNNFQFNLPVDNNLVKNDHSIFNPLTDLKTYFPQASVYPILIGQKVDPKTLDSLFAQIRKKCLSDCLLVASVDFSHYLPATLAEVHDAYTINNLQNLDTDNILKSEVDSPQSLYILTKFSQSKKFNLFAHTNSGFLSRNPDFETTTHVFGSYSKGLFKKSNVITSTVTPQSFDRSYGVDNFQLDSSTQFVFSNITTTSQIIKSILPIKNSLFIRGQDKQKIIKDYLDSVPNAPNLTKDYFWGKLIYERR